MINQKCIRNRRIDLKHARYHDVTQRKIDSRKIHSNDVLINSTGVGTLGRLAIVPQDMAGLIVDSHVTIVRVNHQKANKIWFGQSLLQLQPYIEKMGHGTTGQTELQKDHLENISLILPSRKISEAFDCLTIPIFEKIRKNELEEKTLSKLRDNLLPKLISYEIDLNNDCLPDAPNILEIKE